MKNTNTSFTEVTGEMKLELWTKIGMHVLSLWT